jgi:hypothetical protein
MYWRRHNGFDHVDRAVGFGQSVFFPFSDARTLYGYSRMVDLFDLALVVFCAWLFMGHVVGGYAKSHACTSRMVLSGEFVFHFRHFFRVYVVPVPVPYLHAFFLFVGTDCLVRMSVCIRCLLDAY